MMMTPNLLTLPKYILDNLYQTTFIYKCNCHTWIRIITWMLSLFYQRNNATKCWILILFWITLCWISWPIYHLGIKARAVFESTETGLLKNAQDFILGPSGSWEIAKTKVDTVLLDTLYNLASTSCRTKRIKHN